MELLTAGRYVISEIKNTIEGQGINTLPLKVYALKWLHFRFFQPLILTLHTDCGCLKSSVSTDMGTVYRNNHKTFEIYYETT